MVRLFSLVSLLVAVAVTTFLWSHQSSQAREQAPTAILQAAGAALELNHRINGTYSGVHLDGVTLVRADAASYCIEAGSFHLTGPGGAPAAGDCT
jgi:hypothetical protein